MAGRRQSARRAGPAAMTERVIVTGASSGIGAACVAAFQTEGTEVVGVDLRESSGADRHISLDLASTNCGEALISAIGDLSVDGLINNAALQLDKPAEETDVEDFDRLCAVNLRAPFLLSSALRPALREGKGYIVNVASVHAMATSKFVSVYAATKGGLVALTRALAIEWAPEIRVNAVLPGAVQTDMLINGLARNDLTLDELGRRHPVQRTGKPEEVASAILFLARNEFATGSALTLDGGATARLSTE